MENGDDHSDEIKFEKKKMESEALAKGLSSTLATIIKEFDAKAQQTFTSQDQLSQSLDRLTRGN